MEIVLYGREIMLVADALRLGAGVLLLHPTMLGKFELGVVCNNSLAECSLPIFVELDHSTV